MILHQCPLLFFDLLIGILDRLSVPVDLDDANGYQHDPADDHDWPCFVDAGDSLLGCLVHTVRGNGLVSVDDGSLAESRESVLVLLDVGQSDRVTTEAGGDYFIDDDACLEPFTQCFLLLLKIRIAIINLLDHISKVKDELSVSR